MRSWDPWERGLFRDRRENEQLREQPIYCGREGSKTLKETCPIGVKRGNGEATMERGAGTDLGLLLCPWRSHASSMSAKYIVQLRQ